MVSESRQVQSKVNKRKVVRVLLIIAGSVSLFCGVLGIFLPILPTTPFLLLSAACYMRGSERMYNWLLNNRWFGRYIRNYQAGLGIPLKTKVLALSVLWGTILFSMFFVLRNNLIVQVVLLVIAVAVSVHLIRLPTFKNRNKN